MVLGGWQCVTFFGNRRCFCPTFRFWRAASSFVLTPLPHVSLLSGREAQAADGGRNTLVSVPGAAGVGGHKGARPLGVYGPRRLHGRAKGGEPASLAHSPGTHAQSLPQELTSGCCRVAQMFLRQAIEKEDACVARLSHPRPTRLLPRALAEPLPEQPCAEPLPVCRVRAGSTRLRMASGI